ncbi:hypothetical protein HHK36_018750 [Tetracentron sinense]|uniref:WRKY domain-containing protein n=1 Tax=Tetracentron sinense TaxID=13715 RepID=A0A834YST6_TETSI|nr:hypothetical protein HHK36_018750 [Tetracentron sinense]
MDSSWPENLATNRENVIDELVRGREYATQLQFILHEPLGDHGTVPAEDLIVKILRSFTKTLSLLDSSDSGEVSQNPATTNVSSPCFDDRRSENSGESRKSPALKDGRGGYKRRKTSNTCTKVTPNPVDDGHAWRKYGQKEILNAKYPRNYFRCTHKIDQGCQATKQVQRIEEDPPKFRTIYMGHHTCKDTRKASHLILDSTPRGSYFIGFESNIPTKHDHLFPSIKQEHREEIPSDITQNHSSSDYLFSSDLTTFDTSVPTTMLGSDQGDVISGLYSCTTSSRSLDMGFMVGSMDFDNMFHFEDDGFFLAQS